MAVNNVLLLFQGTGYIVALMLSLCVVIPLALNLECFKGHCLLFTTGSFGDDGNFNADWASKAYCGYIMTISSLLVLVSFIQAVRMFTMLRRETDSSFLSAFLDCISTIILAVMVFIGSIMVTLGFKTWCDAVTQRFRSCDDASIMEISKADNVQTKGFFIQIGTVQFGIWSSWSPENSKEKLLKLELMKPTLIVSSNMQSAEGVGGHCPWYYYSKKSKYNCERSSLKNNVATKQLLSPTVVTSSDFVINLNPQENVIKTIDGREEEKNVAAVLNSIAQEMGSTLKAETLEATVDEDICSNCLPLNELIKEYGGNLFPEFLGELKSAAGFLKFLDTFRRASKKELLMLFKNTDRRILTQLLDVLAAAQTNDALDVAFELIDFESKDIDIAERFFTVSCNVSKSSEVVISKTLQFIFRNFSTGILKRKKLKATILITLSSLVRTYCTGNTANLNSLIVQNVNKILMNGLQECKDVACIVNHLLALRNIALPQNLPVLVEYVKRGEEFLD
ncbi:hypothetical protein CEXT_201161 [Caerostris extrusa]|uniref:Vitellogenin domain-containing protein n=1 Tax=Caerostris extrusa TaxID=172846 RepID=A0AAV4PTH0_CAEEX|nr:hypothetical protein CEXT_201161 [Caerostris extrusa]